MYLVVGRRGSGKTALTQYFSFQNVIKNPIILDVDEPEEYEKVLDSVGKWSGSDSDRSVRRAEKIWRYLIWCLIFERTKDHGEKIKSACIPCQHSDSDSGILNRAVSWLVETWNPPENDEEFVSGAVDEEIDAALFKSAVEEVITLASKRPIIIAIDTLERYDFSETLMTAIAGLVQFSAKFNNIYSLSLIHI